MRPIQVLAVIVVLALTTSCKVKEWGYNYKANYTPQDEIQIFQECLVNARHDVTQYRYDDTSELITACRNAAANLTKDWVCLNCKN